MRLIDIETRKLESFFGDSIPPYAILSHTWGRDDEELSFSDIQDGPPETGLTTKVKGCLRQARLDGLRYVWIDTCCIDKTNSVELNEAINSMFRWYEEAKVCYVYLAECPDPKIPSSTKLPPSSWFRRGWTLQELLAPKELRFYAADWRLIGDRRTVASDVSKITGIPVPFLAKYRPLREASVAQRMSWASDRVTKREEDIAYCLLGIFDISMTMNYGERGPRSFQRLQRKILEEIDDDSILAWGRDIPTGANLTAANAVYLGALAESPRDFAGCGGILAFTHKSYAKRPRLGPGYIEVTGITPPEFDHVTYAILQCGNMKGESVGVPLCWTGKAKNGMWARPRWLPAVIYVPSPPLLGNPDPETIQISTVGGHLDMSADADIACRLFIDTSAIAHQLVEVFPDGYWKAGDDSIVVKSATPKDIQSSHLIIVRLRAPNSKGPDIIGVLALNLRTGESVDSEGSPGAFSLLRCSDPRDELEDIWQCYRVMKPESVSRTVPSNSSSLRVQAESFEDGMVKIIVIRVMVQGGTNHDFDYSKLTETREVFRYGFRDMAEELGILRVENQRLVAKYRNGHVEKPSAYIAASGRDSPRGMALRYPLSALPTPPSEWWGKGPVVGERK